MDRDEELLSSLGGWSGFEIVDFERREGDPSEIWITLKRKDETPLLCGACGREASRVHEHQERVVRDLPPLDARTYLKIESCRVWCEHCGGPKRQQIDWVDDQQRVTRRLAESILSLCSHVAIRHIAQFFGVHWHTVKRLDKRRLRERFATTDYSDVRVIGVDEFALHKGHRYATVVVEPSRRRVLWVGKGRDTTASSSKSRPPSPVECEEPKKSPGRCSGLLQSRSLAVSYSHMGRPHTTIGAERFHFRVRNGIGWFPLAIAARQTV